jgi:E3 ubiquitin-protein ligase BRE1
VRIQDRIAALELESKRLKSQLAANAGEDYLLELILSEKLKDLPERLQYV